MINLEVFVLSCNCEAESLVSKYMYICFDCLVRIFEGQPRTQAIRGRNVA